MKKFFVCMVMTAVVVLCGCGQRKASSDAETFVEKPLGADTMIVNGEGLCGIKGKTSCSYTEIVEYHGCYRAVEEFNVGGINSKVDYLLDGDGKILFGGESFSYVEGEPSYIVADNNSGAMHCIYVPSTKLRLVGLKDYVIGTESMLCCSLDDGWYDITLQGDTLLAPDDNGQLYKKGNDYIVPYDGAYLLMDRDGKGKQLVSLKELKKMKGYDGKKAAFLK